MTEKYKIEYDSTLDLKTIKVSSPVTRCDLVQLVSSDDEIQEPRNIMWVIAPGTLQNLSLDDLKQAVEMSRMRLFGRRGGKTILVADDPSEALLMKWYQAYVNSLEGIPVELTRCATSEEGKVLLRGVQAS